VSTGYVWSGKVLASLSYSLPKIFFQHLLVKNA
jgi:hypothetical protein